MNARVKQDCRWHIVRACAGRDFTKKEWRPVPSGHELEVINHPMLDIDRGGKVVIPDPKPVVLENLSRAKLVKMAKERGGIKGVTRMRKPQLIEVLSNE